MAVSGQVSCPRLGSSYCPLTNCSYATVAAEYQAVLASSESFRALTLEQVVDSAFAHDKHLAESFKSRYL